MAREMIDYKFDDDGDLEMSGGDLVRVESTYQHQRQLLLNAKGDYKAHPTVCVGIMNYIDDTGKEGLVREISQQFLRDGMEVKDLKPNTESATDSTVAPFINAFYK